MCGRKVIAVDFDGTLFELGEFPEFGNPRWDVINAIKQEKKNGTAIILWTCRTGDDLASAIDACQSVGIEFDAVNDSLGEWKAQFKNNPHKIGATEYWDDKAIRIGIGPQISLDDDDFGLILNSAVRYALGRMTYVPSTVISFITPLLPYINSRTITVMERDIVDQERYGYGMDCDRKGWLRFLKQIREEIAYRRDRQTDADDCKRNRRDSQNG